MVTLEPGVGDVHRDGVAGSPGVFGLSGIPGSANGISGS